MSYPYLVGIVPSRTGSNSTSHTVNIPSFVEADDLLLAFFSSDGTGAATFPGGWTEAIDTTQGGEIRGVVAWLRATGSEGWGDTGNTITVTTAGSEEASTIVVCVRGAHTSTDPEFASAGASISSPDPPSLDPTGWGTEETFWLSGIAYNDSSNAVISYPSGWGIKSYERSSVAAGSCGQVLVGKLNTAASEDPGTWTFPTATHAVLSTVAIRPASAAAAPSRATFPDVAAVTSSEATATTTHTVNLPDSLAVGDILVIPFAGTGGGSIDQTSPFLEMRTAAQEGVIVSQIWWRYIDGSEGWGDTGNTVTITTVVTQRSTTIAYRVRGAALPLEWDGSGQTTPNPDPPSIDSSFWGTEDTTWMAYTCWDNGTITLSSYPTNFGDNQTTVRTNTSPGTGSALATRDQNASSQDPGTFTISSNAHNHAYSFGFVGLFEEAIAKVSLGNMADPGVSYGHILRIRARKENAGDTGDLLVSLVEGSTVRASMLLDALTTSFVTYTQTLTDAETNSISNYNNLELWFEATSTLTPQISLAELEVPSTAVTVTPAVIALSTIHPAVTVAAAATVSPAVIALTVVPPSATIAAAAVIAPAVIALAVTLPTPTVLAAAVVEPAVIALSVTLPQAVASVPITVAPDVIALSVILPASTVLAAATVTPDVLALVVVLPPASVLAAATVTPAVIAIAVTLPASAVLAAATVEPAVIALSVTLPAVTVITDATAAPDVIALSVTLDPVTITAGATVNVQVISLAVNLDAVTVTAGATVTPATISLSVTILQVTVLAGANVSPAVIALSVVLPPATVAVPVLVTPDTILLSIVLPAASVAAAATVVPDTIVLAITLPAVTITAGASVTPDTIVLVVVLPQAAAATGDTALPDVIPLSIELPAVVVAIPATVTPAVIVLTLTIYEVDAGVILTPPTGLTAIAVSSTRIDVSWDAVSGATHYDLERDAVIIVEKTTATSFQDEGLTPGSEHVYRVRSARAA